MTILYINDEHCSSVEQLKKFFKAVTSYDNPIGKELLDYGYAGDIAEWLREKGEIELAETVANINSNLGDSEYLSQLSVIFTGEKVIIEKPEFQKCFHVENITTEKDDNRMTVCVRLKILSSVNESYELAVRTNWGTKGNIVNPYNFDEGSTVNLKFKFRKRPNSVIDKIVLFADKKEVYNYLIKTKLNTQLPTVLSNSLKRNGNNGKKADSENVNGLKAPVSYRDTSVQDKPISGEPKRYRWQTDSFLRQIEKDKKEREQRLEHQKKVREELEMKYKLEQEERERKEMQEKYRRRFGEQETKDFKCPKCGYCTQIPYKKVKYRCHMCGRVWSV